MHTRRVTKRIVVLLICITPLFFFMTWLPTVSAHQQTVRTLPTTVIVKVQDTPTSTDPTVTALDKEQLRQDIDQQRHDWYNWLWDNASTLLSTLALLAAALFGIFRWLGDRRTEQEKRSEERFQSVVTNLGSSQQETQVGAAIVLRTFLHRGYEQFYAQVFDLTIALLRQPKADQSAIVGRQGSLKQALVVAFKEAYPLARDWLKQHPRTLNASAIQLDYAYLSEAKLKAIWMPEANLYQAILRRANLTEALLSDTDFSEADLSNAIFTKAQLRRVKFIEANLSGVALTGARLRRANFMGANLTDAVFSGADLSEANPEAAQSLLRTRLHNVTGLSSCQLAICKAKGAITDLPVSPVNSDKDSKSV